MVNCNIPLSAVAPQCQARRFAALGAKQMRICVWEECSRWAIGERVEGGGVRSEWSARDLSLPSSENKKKTLSYPVPFGFERDHSAQTDKERFGQEGLFNCSWNGQGQLIPSAYCSNKHYKGSEEIQASTPPPPRSFTALIPSVL